VFTPLIGWHCKLRPNTEGTEPFNVSALDWDKVAVFATATGASLVLSLNQLLRSWPNGGVGGCGEDEGAACQWNPSNAKAWIKHNRDSGHRLFGYVDVAPSLAAGLGSRYDGGARVLHIAAREHLHHTSRAVGFNQLLTL
jgi:hypothetical protein